jgi:hypothetical protein
LVRQFVEPPTTNLPAGGSAVTITTIQNEIICNIQQEVINFAKAWQDGFNRLPAF